MESNMDMLQEKSATHQPLESIAGKINVFLSARRIVVAFFTMFWLLNGLDKFLNRQPFWYGDHRDLKFITYFASIHLPAPVALIVLHSLGVIETLLGIGFLTALLSRKIPLVFSQIYFKASILIFLLYSIGDIIFGDRAELLEHGTYLALIMICFAFFLWKGSDESVESNPA
jgi:hypothetical protein